MHRFDVVTIGEGQLRYSVPQGNRLENVDKLDVHACGTEANVVSLLSRLGWKCGWLSGLPDTPLGRRVANQFKLSGIDLSAVVWSSTGRIATYYVEYASPPRQTQVYYDRANTCFTNLTSEQVDWDYLTDARIIHLSGLTVPLSQNLQAIVAEIVKGAKAKRAQVSFDVNYRSRIWSPTEARKALLPIIRDVDILFCSQSDARTVFGAEGEPEKILRQMGEMTSARYLVSSMSAEGLFGWDRTTVAHQPACSVSIIDRIGAGDAMVAGVLHGLLQGDFLRALRYGVVGAALALAQFGDQVVTTKTELEELANDSNSTDICR